ncbi:hypothetical protein [Dietzia alimentaria]|uniref:hypothetical protein n=1 Tax=Dietzia alimentaria TaxID=665550 RepID=UPI00029A1045|nr:hypothetical protein [Dietzia alimentaria]
MATLSASTDTTVTSTASITDRDAALLAAYAELMAETGRRPSIRTLRERARVSTDAAADWLRHHAPERRAPEIPAESLAPVLAPLWAAAVDMATQSRRDEHQTTLAAHLESEARALADAEQAATKAQQQVDRAAAAETRVENLAREIVTAQQAAHRAREQAHEADTTAAETRERAHVAIHQAEQAVAQAEAEATTLREALAAIVPTTDTTQEKS